MDALETLLPKALAAVVAKGQSPDLWASTLDPFMSHYGINTPKRIAAFIGQVAVESEGFSMLEEDLNYSAPRLVEVWPSRFEDGGADPETCAHNPEALANVVYANRMGNGDEASGDGWRYRGAGLIQLTGKTNQEAFAEVTKLDPRLVGVYLRTAKGAAESACWFWAAHGLNALADGWFVTAISRKINGGDEGLPQRIAACNLALKAIS